MRPLIRALFVLSVFGVLAMHVSTGLLRDMLDTSAPQLVDAVDRGLRIMLIDPIGRDATIFGLWGVGGALAFFAFILSPVTTGKGPEKHSTW